MGYLTSDLPEELCDYLHDVFVSYTHGAISGESNTPLRVWSQKLANDLKVELATSLSSEVNLFLDSNERQNEGVDRTADLATDLQRHIDRSAILTALLSKPYLRSRWCTQERDWWLARNTPDLLAAGGRLFLCRAMPVEETDCPETLKGMLGYPFHDKDKPPDRARPFNYGGTNADTDDYMEALLRLSGDIAQRLRDVRKILDDRHCQWKQQQKATASSGQILYLYGRKESETAWTSACDRLQRQAFVVNPEGPEPLAENGGLSRDAQIQLTESDGLLILGTENGKALDSDMVVVGKNYRHLAIAERKAELPCAVFDTAGPSLQQERRLRNAAHLRISWIDGTRPDWPERLADWLKAAR